ncbi:MAG: hypothetical protein PHG99_02600 [Erysipelotrichaceae bacterium]|nr:hypothetical protein [Erysipelotrichaceae bacterium]MDD4642377.1 hypothetical protein [Erysipelotrichaceae bacterium]
MKKYLSLLNYELKTIYRDFLQLYMLVFPILILLFAIYLVPTIMDTLIMDDNTTYYVMLLLVIMLMSFGVFIIGAMGSFLLLEHKDEKTINTIAVTPLGINGYLRFKLLYIYIFALVSILVVLIGMKVFASDVYIIKTIEIFDNISYSKIILHAIVAAMFAPTLSLLQAALAHNKVEGFAIMKLSSLMALAPMIMIFRSFEGYLQYLLGIFPNFWAIKAFILEFFPNQNMANLSFNLYLLGGVIVNTLLFILFYRLFIRKINY